MKIDIGTDGRILGTKRVSTNGQVSGFTEYAGMDVLVILPGGRAPVVRRDASDLLAQAEQLVKEQMELAFRKYRDLQTRYGSPEHAARSFLQGIPKTNFRGLVQKVDAWVREQLPPTPGAAKRTSRSSAVPKKK